MLEKSKAETVKEEEPTEGEEATPAEDSPKTD